MDLLPNEGGLINTLPCEGKLSEETRGLGNLHCKKVCVTLRLNQTKFWLSISMVSLHISEQFCSELHIDIDIGMYEPIYR